MNFSISKAAEMAGVSRATFYSHIEKNHISLEDAGTNRPKVPLSELVRVYGDKIQMGKKTEVSNSEKQDTSVDEKVRLATLEAELKHQKALRAVEKKSYETQLQLLTAILTKDGAGLAEQLSSLLAMAPVAGAAAQQA